MAGPAPVGVFCRPLAVRGVRRRRSSLPERQVGTGHGAARRPDPSARRRIAGAQLREQLARLGPRRLDLR